jgi:hypothetical protein
MSSKRAKISAPLAGGGGGGGGVAPTFSFTFSYEQPTSSDEEAWEAVEHPTPKIECEYDEFDEGLHRCTAVIRADGQALGKASLLFLQRCTDDFFSNCDSVSQDLQETSCLLFESDGEPRHPLVHAHMDNDLGEDFLYVDDLDIDAARKELGPPALKALLTALLALRPWSLVAFYKCAPSSRHDHYRCNDTPASRAAYLDLAAENRLLVVSAGFTQVDASPLYIAAPKHMMSPALSRAVALAVPERMEPQLKAMSAPNAELFELTKSALSNRASTFDGASVKRIKKLLAEGATLADALALHVCATSGSLEGLALLLRLVPKEQGVAAVQRCVSHPACASSPTFALLA